MRGLARSVVVAAACFAAVPEEALADPPEDEEAASPASEDDRAGHELTDETCAASYECRRHGWCAAEGAKCVAASTQDCTASTTCRESGMRCHFDSVSKKCVSALARPKPAREPQGVSEWSESPSTTFDSRYAVREAGVALTVIGGVGMLTGLVAGGLWELSNDPDTQDTLLKVSLGAGIPGAAMTGAGLIMIRVRDDVVTASVGPGSLRVTY
jgi:hypothetical protein